MNTKNTKVEESKESLRSANSITLDAKTYEEWKTKRLFWKIYKIIDWVLVIALLSSVLWLVSLWYFQNDGLCVYDKVCINYCLNTNGGF